jgi:hypothetical protein
MMGATRRSRTYGDVLLGKYDFVCSDIAAESDVEGSDDPNEDTGDGAVGNTGELGIERSMSWVSVSVLCSKIDASYAIVVSTIWRNIMRKSSPRSCNLDGTYAKVEVTKNSTLDGPARRTQTNEIKHNRSSFRRTFRRMMPYTGCIKE